MISLYQTYTVSVQSSTAPYAPDNDLELQLFEGHVEIKPDILNAGKKAVFDYGTTVKSVPVYDKNGVACSALIADAIERPGEYDFVDIDLNKSNSLSYSGETLYSVVAIPTSYDPSDVYANSKVVVTSKDLSDQNIKQIVRAAIGGTNSLTSNIVIAGGSVAFAQYTNGVVNHNYDQYLKITDLPSDVTDMTEIATSYPTFATSTKLCLRFNVYYSNGTDVIRWEGIPCYKTTDNSWVIKLQRDQYNTYRSKEFGGGGLIDLGAIWQNLIITMDPTNNNVYFRRFDTNPTVALPTTGSSFERTIIHTHMDGTEPVAGIGAWTYSGVANIPSYNLDVMGSRGVRVKTGAQTKVLITGSDSTFGYDTTASYFKSTPGSSSVAVGGITKFSGTGSIVVLGLNVSLYPRINMTSATAKIESASNTYISINTSNQIYGYVGGTQKFSLDASNSKIGYDTTQSYFGTSSGSVTSVLAGLTKFIGTTTYVLLGHNVSAYPRIYCDATALNLYGTATSYFSVTSSNQLYAYRNSVLSMAIDSAQTTLKFNTSYTFSMTATAVSILATYLRFYTTSAMTIVGHDFTVSYTTPFFAGTSTYAKVQGNIQTYLQVNHDTHATEPDSIWANVKDTTTKRSISLRGGGVNDYRFGYNVTDAATGIYYKVTSGATSLIHQNNTLLTYDSTAGNLVLGYGGIANPYALINSTSVRLVASSMSLNLSSIAITLQKTLLQKGLYITTSESTLYHTSASTDDTYVKVASNRIDLRPGTLNGTHTNAYAYVGRTTAGTNIGVGYIKVPYVTVDQPPSASDYPQGALIVCNDATGLISRLFYKTFDGWKFVGIGSAP